MKVTFMGAGSTVFSKNVLGDTMLCDSFHDAEIALYDIDPDRLEESYLVIEGMNKTINEGRATIKSTSAFPKERMLFAVPISLSMLFKSVFMTLAPSSTLRSRRNTVCAKPLATPSVLAALCAACVPFTL